MVVFRLFWRLIVWVLIHLKSGQNILLKSHLLCSTEENKVLRVWNKMKKCSFLGGELFHSSTTMKERKAWVGKFSLLSVSSQGFLSFWLRTGILIRLLIRYYVCGHSLWSFDKQTEFVGRGGFSELMSFH